MTPMRSWKWYDFQRTDKQCFAIRFNFTCCSQRPKSPAPQLKPRISLKRVSKRLKPYLTATGLCQDSAHIITEYVLPGVLAWTLQLYLICFLTILSTDLMLTYVKYKKIYTNKEYSETSMLHLTFMLRLIWNTP